MSRIIVRSETFQTTLVIVHQSIKYSQLRTRHCAQTKASLVTEIRREVSYAAREGSRFHLVFLLPSLRSCRKYHPRRKSLTFLPCSITYY